MLSVEHGRAQISQTYANLKPGSSIGDRVAGNLLQASTPAGNTGKSALRAPAQAEDAGVAAN
jgi:hypothetical protein